MNTQTEKALTIQAEPARKPVGGDNPEALTETDVDYAEFDHTPQGATITFITGSRARQGIIIDFTDRSMDVHCNDGTRARLTRARWEQRRVRMGDLTHRERKEAGEHIGLGTTLDQETNPWIREVLIDLASTGAHLASVPDSWLQVPGVTGFIAQWRPTHDRPEPGCIRITQVLNGEEVRNDGFAALNTARNHLIRLGWKVGPAGHGGMLITLDGPTPRF